MIDYTYIRSVGNLPDKVGDDKIAPHRLSATKDIQARAGREINDTGDEDEDYREAIACQTIYYLLPVINTMFLDGAAKFARDCDDMNDYVFMTPLEVEKVQRHWLNRVERVFARISMSTEDETDDNVTAEVI